MLVDGAPAHAPAAAAATATGAKPSTASEGLLAILAASGGSFKADDITFSLRTMLDKGDHSLPGSLVVLKQIEQSVTCKFHKAVMKQVDIGSKTCVELDGDMVKIHNFSEAFLHHVDLL